MDELDKLILEALNGGPLTRYEIAKKIGVAWCTVDKRCFKLGYMGLLGHKDNEVGFRTRRVWFKVGGPGE